MRCRFVLSLLLILSIWPIASSRAATREPDRSRQCLVVLTDDWASTTGVMRSFERNGSSDAWKERRSVNSGRGGEKKARPGTRPGPPEFARCSDQKGGDDRAPAGIFRLSSAFGYAPAVPLAGSNFPIWRYRNGSKASMIRGRVYYNRFVDRSKVAKVDWRSSGEMRRYDGLYKWGVVVDHNPEGYSGADSRIFLAHLGEPGLTYGGLHCDARARSGADCSAGPIPAGIRFWFRCLARFTGRFGQGTTCRPIVRNIVAPRQSAGTVCFEGNLATLMAP